MRLDPCLFLAPWPVYKQLGASKLHVNRAATTESTTDCLFYSILPFPVCPKRESGRSDYPPCLLFCSTVVTHLRASPPSCLVSSRDKTSTVHVAVTCHYSVILCASCVRVPVTSPRVHYRERKCLMQKEAIPNFEKRHTPNHQL